MNAVPNVIPSTPGIANLVTRFAGFDKNLQRMPLFKDRALLRSLKNLDKTREVVKMLGFSEDQLVQYLKDRSKRFTVNMVTTIYNIKAKEKPEEFKSLKKFLYFAQGYFK
jgi:hypothetical protein